MDELAVIQEHLPQTVKEAVARYRTPALINPDAPMEDFTLDKMAMAVGTMMSERRNRWRPVAEGLIALKQLGG